MSAAITQVAAIFPQPWRDRLVQAGRRQDLAAIDSIHAELKNYFPELFQSGARND